MASAEQPPRAKDAVDRARDHQDVFARSYDEVLAALKHQDDKLNRTLTALAFLTAAGVALFARAATSGATVLPIADGEGSVQVLR